MYGRINVYKQIKKVLNKSKMEEKMGVILSIWQTEGCSQRVGVL